MKLILDVKQRCNFFWLRGIHSARIDQCCAKCFNADTFHEVYEATRYKDKAHVEVDITPDPKVKAYYLCGLSNGFKWEYNTHVAFVPDEGKTIEIDNERIHLTVTDARQIDFQGYVPNPVGEYTPQQRHCRNWIFANYLLDGQPL